MTPLYFDAAGRRLYGVLHGGLCDVGVLMVGPHGQEAVRVHRMLRVLSDRLSRQGLPVLRFDPFGSGDSEGTDEDLNLATWTRDVVAADAQLRERARCSATIWLGIRLGATAALLAAGRSTPRALVLWEPVVDGEAYLRSLAADHAQALRYSFGPLRPCDEAPPPPAHLGEALGFGMSDTLCTELVRLEHATLPAPARACTVIAPASHAAARWIGAHTAASGAAARCRFVSFEHRFDWTSEEALNTALVPADAVRLLVGEVEASR
jgi:hypothetical protein